MCRVSTTSADSKSFKSYSHIIYVYAYYLLDSALFYALYKYVCRLYELQ